VVGSTFCVEVFILFYPPQRTLKTTWTQTDPVQDEAFDWDLSDKADNETQTRSNSSVLGRFGNVLGLGVGGDGDDDEDDSLPQDALVQTDQVSSWLA
jgi:hypothetical protein